MKIPRWSLHLQTVERAIIYANAKKSLSSSLPRGPSYMRMSRGSLHLQTAERATIFKRREGRRLQTPRGSLSSTVVRSLHLSLQ